MRAGRHTPQGTTVAFGTAAPKTIAIDPHARTVRAFSLRAREVFAGRFGFSRTATQGGTHGRSTTRNWTVERLSCAAGPLGMEPATERTGRRHTSIWNARTTAAAIAAVRAPTPDAVGCRAAAADTAALADRAAAASADSVSDPVHRATTVSAGLSDAADALSAIVLPERWIRRITATDLQRPGRRRADRLRDVGTRTDRSGGRVRLTRPL